jgi:hypothetical protein
MENAELLQAVQAAQAKGLGDQEVFDTIASSTLRPIYSDEEIWTAILSRVDPKRKHEWRMWNRVLAASLVGLGLWNAVILVQNSDFGFLGILALVVPAAMAWSVLQCHFHTYGLIMAFILLGVGRLMPGGIDDPWRFAPTLPIFALTLFLRMKLFPKLTWQGKPRNLASTDGGTGAG